VFQHPTKFVNAGSSRGTGGCDKTNSAGGPAGIAVRGRWLRAFDPREDQAMIYTTTPHARAASRRTTLGRLRLGVAVSGVAIAFCLGLGYSAARPSSAAASSGWLGATGPSRTIFHMPTWAFDDGCSGGAGASGGLVRRWVTFAETNCGTHAKKAYSNCHFRGRRYCFAMQYLETNSLSPRLPLASTSWFLHKPPPRQNTPITGNFVGQYLLNPANPAVRSYFRSYVRKHYNTYDGLLMDGQSAALGEELYYAKCGCSRTSEIRTSAALRSAHRKMSAAISHRNGAPFMQVDNSALAPNPFLPQGIDMLDHPAGVYGLVIEGEPEDYGVLDPFYSTLLDQIAYVANRTGGFVMPLSYGQAGASSQSQARRVQEATMLLGWTPGHLVDWADLELGRTSLAVWPEEGIYPTDPLQSMRTPSGRGCLAGTGHVCSRGGHHDLRVAPGVYRREFGSCLDRKVWIGKCAAIVNTTHSWVVVQSSWLRKHYGHAITLVGGDVQSGGWLDVRGAQFKAGSTPIPPQDAVLLSR
jgi:hypothetical protein